MDSTQIAFTMILHAGNARNYSLDALRRVREQQFAQAGDCMNKAKEELIQAHRLQTDLLQQEAAGSQQEVSLLLVHAQDHLMNAILARDLIEEIILLHKKQQDAAAAG